MARLYFCAIAMWSMSLMGSSDKASVISTANTAPKFGVKIVAPAKRLQVSQAEQFVVSPITSPVSHKRIAKSNRAAALDCCVDFFGCLAFCCAYHTEMCCICVSDCCGCEHDNVLND